MSGASVLDPHTKRLQNDLARKELQLSNAEATSRQLYNEKVVLLTKKYELIAEKWTLIEENQQLQERLTKIHKLCGSVHVYRGVDTLGDALKQIEALSGRQQAPGRLPAAAAAAASSESAAGAAAAGSAHSVAMQQAADVSQPDWWLDLAKIAEPAATAAEKAGIVPARIAAPAATAAEAVHVSWLEAYNISMQKLIKRQTNPAQWTPGYSEPIVWGSALLGSESDGTPAAASNASLVSAGRKRDHVGASRGDGGGSSVRVKQEGALMTERE